MFLNWKKAGAFMKALGRTTPGGTGWPRQLEIPIKKLKHHQFRRADLSCSQGPPGIKGLFKKQFIASALTKIKTGSIRVAGPVQTGPAIEFHLRLAGPFIGRATCGAWPDAILSGEKTTAFE